ncbi:MAG: hypothetical protein AB8B83_01420 [Bdellovibrionales bacterium]
MRCFVYTVLIFVCFVSVSDARPVSYPGGWTVMLRNNGESNSAHVHYSPSAKMSIGVRSEYMRDDDFYFNGAQINYLAKRWNKKHSQANFYLQSAVGLAYSDAGEFDGETDAAGFVGMAADWEDRRYFVSYQNRYFEAGDIHDSFHQSGRIGIAPYIGDYGDLHTWLMLQVDHDPENDEKVSVTPLVRLFKDMHLMEAGISNQGNILFNYFVRF